MIRFNRKKAKRFIISRALPMFLAAVMLFTSAPMTGISVGEGDSAGEDTYISNTPLKYDYDTLKITKDGDEVSELEIYSHEKIEVSGAGLNENAEYQWQIKHPEKNNLWVDIYDATKDNIGVSVALINNMMAEDGTAKLRLRAYTEDYAYLSNALTVKLVEEESDNTPTLSVNTVTAPSAMAGGDVSDDHPEFVTVKINYIKWEYTYNSVNDTYVLTEMGDAFSSYMATLVYNGSLETTVTNPTIIGFDPYLGDSTTSTEKVEINLTNITENIVYTVNYKPAKVKYEVNYYFQNIYDDLYAEDLTLAPHFIGEGYTGMPPYYKEDSNGNIIKDTTTKEGVYAEFKGFTALYYQPDTIAADGSTVFEVYYERNYYLMEFDCAGGYGVHTLYVRHGTYISVPEPTRPGYVFNGWDKLNSAGNGDGTTDTIPENMPIGNTAYIALWRTATTTYTVVYWRENADDNGYSYWGSVQQNATSATPVSGTSFTTAPNSLPERTYFTYNSEKTIAEENARTDLIGGKVIVEGDGSTVVNTYFSRNVYALEFDLDGKTFVVPGGGHTHGDGNCSCLTANHVHGPECVKGTTPICELEEHEHSSCTLSCTHVHDSSCCDKEEHTHNTVECCDKEEHTHGLSCLWGYICSEDEHTHGDGNCNTDKCGKSEHSHTDGTCNTSGCDHSHDATCYSCGKVSHTHTDACYEWSCGADDHTHSVDCCTKPENYVSNGTYFIRAKYNQTIGDVWPTSAHYSGLYGWSIEGQTSTPAVSKKVNMTTDLCDTSDGIRVITARADSTSYTVHLYYMFESFDQTSPENGNDRKKYDGVFYDKSELYYQDVRSASNKFSQKAITGMTAVDVVSVRITNNEYNNFLYYTRNSDTFTYFNYNEELTDNPNNNIQIKFEKPLSYLQISKEDMEELYYPSTLEPNAYEFGGWYTTPKCFPGTEVNWDTLTMPDGPLTLYAKWTPVVRNVTFYLLYTDIAADNPWYPPEVTEAQKPGYYPLKVPHGKLLGTTYSHIPTRGSDYQFIGWFYFDENGKKKFAPDSMKVTRDLELFAEWLSTIPTTYEVKYEAWDEKTNTKIEDIADKLEGYSTAGKTTTFNAKGDKALYDKKPPNSTSTTYQSQWFPEHSSHSILMDQDSSKNTHTFKYYYKEYINYKVIHIDRATGTILHESEVKRTSNAIVTEKFMAFQDYLPESYYVEKAIAYDSTNYNEPGKENFVQPENIIYFYYNEDKSHDPFRVEHYYEELDSSWKLKFSENGIANNEDIISRDARNDTGFVFDHYEITTYSQVGDEWVPNTISGTTLPATGKVSVHGMEIRFYYKRKLVDYTVKYVEHGSNPEKVLKTETFEKQKKFGEEVTVTAVPSFMLGELTYIHVEGIDSTVLERSITKDMREDAEDNVFVFYYNLKTFDVYYHAVCPTPGSDGLNGVSVSKQTISVLNDSVRSTALTGSGFKFEGWFKDAACTEKITDPAWLADDGKTIVPQGISDEAHYYAKFEPISGSIQITKNVTDPDAKTENQSFLFRIQGQDARNEFVDTIVTIQGQGTVVITDLPIGMYNITELTTWSWEYSATTDTTLENVEVEADIQSNVSFDNKCVGSNWLNGETHEENVFNN